MVMGYVRVVTVGAEEAVRPAVTSTISRVVRATREAERGQVGAGARRRMEALNPDTGPEDVLRRR